MRKSDIIENVAQNRCSRVVGRFTKPFSTRTKRFSFHCHLFETNVLRSVRYVSLFVDAIGAKFCIYFMYDMYITLYSAY